MPPRADVSGDLLFGLLALQAGLIDQSALVAAFHTWCRDGARPMAEILVDREALDPAEREVVSGLVAAHLRRHGGDRAESLAALQVDASAVEVLADVGGPDLSATLSRTGVGPPRLTVNGAAAPGSLPSTEPDPHGYGEPDDSATVDYQAASVKGPRYRIVRKLGAGGLGVVFVALDALLHREVALKQVRPDRGDEPQDRARFLLEAEITARLEHPGIVPVHDFAGGDGDSRPYYVMRLIRGDTLKDAISVFHDDPALRDDPPARALALQKLLRRFLDVCDAVDYAHARGVLHRDIKPSNVVVGKHGETILIDWGLAKAVGRSDHPSVDDERTLVPSSGGDSSETQAGLAVGTPSFMSPEQARGDLGRIGPRSDVYGLGATLYDLLTGRKPFAGPDRFAIVAAVMEGDFPPPRSVDPTIAPALEAICLRAMARRPEARYASARELADEIERWLADAPVLAWPEPATVRLRRWARRHRPLVAAAAVLMVMTTLGSIGAAALLDRHSRRLEAEQRLVADAGDAMLTRVFDEKLASVPQMEPLRRDLARDAAAFFDTSLRRRPDNPAARFTAAKVFHLAANVERQVNQDAAARRRYDEAVGLLEGLVKELPDKPAYREELARVLVSEAEMHRLRGRLREAAPLYRRALDLTAPAGSTAPTDVDRRSRAEALSSLAVLLIEMCRPDEAWAMLEQSVGLWRPLADRDRADVRDRLMTVITLSNLSEALHEAGQPAKAIEASDAAIGRARALLAKAPAGADNNQRFVLGQALRGRALALAAARARPDEARSAIDEAVDRFEKLVADYPSTLNYRAWLVRVLEARADVRAAFGPGADADADLARARDVLRGLISERPETPEDRIELALILGKLAERAGGRDGPERSAATAAALAGLEPLARDNPDRCELQAMVDRLRGAGAKAAAPAPAGAGIP
jgi:serine/threonine-protein kinase